MPNSPVEDNSNRSTNSQAALYQDLTSNLAEQVIETPSPNAPYIPNADYVDPSDSRPKQKISIGKALFIILSGPIIIVGDLVLFSLVNTLLKNQYELKVMLNFGLGIFGLFGVIMILVGPVLGIILLNRSN